MKILVIGSSNTDMCIRMDHLPRAGETVLGGDFFMNQGGKGANQAVAASRLGGDVTFVFKTGQDAFGDASREIFTKEGINIDHSFVDKEVSSGVALIFIDKGAENSIAVASGANGKLLPNDIDSVENVIKEADMILVQLEIPLSSIEHIAEIAKKYGKNLVINPAPAPAQNLSDKLLDGLYLITPNQTEAEILTGVKVVDNDSARLAAQVLLKKGVKNVVITMNSQGAYFLNADKELFSPSFKVEALDTTAAGDVFNGALVVAICEGMDFEEALKFANKAASISVTRMGAYSSAPFRQELK